MQLIRSTRLSLKFANAGKLEVLRDFVEDFGKCLQDCVDEHFNDGFVKPYISARPLGTSISATALQAIGKQASQIIRGERALALKDKRPPTKPCIKSVIPDFDERFIDLDLNTAGEFDAWLTLKRFKSIGKRKCLKLELPLRKTKHLNHLMSRGWCPKGGIKLDIKKQQIIVQLAREVPDERPAKPQCKKSVLGVDVGIADIWTASDGLAASSTPHPHGWTLSKIQQRLARRKRGSKGFKRAQALRDDFIGWSTKQLNLDGVDELHLENIKNLKRNKHVPRFKQAWTYTAILDRLKRRAEERNVSVVLVNPAFTSQTCSACGTVDKKSREGKDFKCRSCGFAIDADLNAARNIQHGRPSVSQRGAYGPSCPKNPRRGNKRPCQG